MSGVLRVEDFFYRKLADRVTIKQACELTGLSYSDIVHSLRYDEPVKGFWFRFEDEFLRSLVINEIAVDGPFTIEEIQMMLGVSKRFINSSVKKFRDRLCKLRKL